ncbi:aspartate kinase [Methyloceanibacter sp.]|uniref:aspartate kinase n=1 Tax=Methyloceanibacter sp. TaxID=1965321 RepID=UPI00208C2AE0|nr:aspartate kinase [Methyloceanibacter sp.]GFO82234.1 MAG: aspartokinase [Methyloceanibacter sp.]HML93062.1 aspartate kinase [Methyloceanibacter sp.]
MSLLVLKFGGTSVADLDRIRNVAAHVKREADAGHACAVVVSAMAGQTNQLVAWVEEAWGFKTRTESGDEASALYDCREYDAVVSSGEQVTSGLLALVLQSMGLSARSWQGWQIPLRTDAAHQKARITGIEVDEIKAAMLGGEVAVCAGFQGIAPNNRIATLGRGGSDTSAVALAAALQADRCDIYTDVDGVYTTDPRVVAKAHRLDRISYEEMLEMASQGAKVLQTRSVELAMQWGVPVLVRSSFDPPDLPGDPDTGEGIGTLVCHEDEIVEQNVVSGIAYARDEAKVTLLKVADKPGVAARVFGPLSDAHINVDMIVQNVSEDGRSTDLTFTVQSADLDRALEVLKSAKDEIGYLDLRGATDIAKVSAIGVGMRSHAGVAAQMFSALAEKGINIEAISTSEIKISVLIDAAYAELAVRTLHTLFGLDGA